ncbi:MAG TPA: Gfo/Idh/MocA family oxidoreductase, partial [Casimicrobiaceae bacterium]
MSRSSSSRNGSACWSASANGRPRTASTTRGTRATSRKNVLCEKPLAISSAEALELVNIAKQKNVANCLNHNLRCYPMVQHMRRMVEAGELGEILVVQGTYSQDWLLYDTDWNWRIVAKENGPLRVMGDIGSHWMDMVQHITGLKITSLCADLQTF